MIPLAGFLFEFPWWWSIPPGWGEGDRVGTVLPSHGHQQQRGPLILPSGWERVRGRRGHFYSVGQLEVFFFFFHSFLLESTWAWLVTNYSGIFASRQQADWWFPLTKHIARGPVGKSSCGLHVATCPAILTSHPLLLAYWVILAHGPLESVILKPEIIP